MKGGLQCRGHFLFLHLGEAPAIAIGDATEKVGPSQVTCCHGIDAAVVSCC